MKVDNATAEDYPELLAVWENSVRATHDFITEDDIAFFKPIIIEQAFPNGVVRPFQRKVQSYSVGLSLQGLQKGVCFSLE